MAQYRLNRRVVRQQERLANSADLYIRARFEKVPIDYGGGHWTISDACVYVENRGAGEAADVQITRVNPKRDERLSSTRSSSAPTDHEYPVR